jgi:hypothetical protein
MLRGVQIKSEYPFLDLETKIILIWSLKKILGRSYLRGM